MFFWRWCKIFNNSFFHRTPPLAASKPLRFNLRFGRPEDSIVHELMILIFFKGFSKLIKIGSLATIKSRQDSSLPSFCSWLSFHNFTDWKMSQFQCFRHFYEITCNLLENIFGIWYFLIWSERLTLLFGYFGQGNYKI